MIAGMSIGRHFNAKLKLGFDGRKNWKQTVNSFRQNNPGKLVWIHCASLGEFEMARPLIDHLNEQKLEHVKILVTFFSPSGYEQRKHFNKVDAVMYLPFDTASNAKWLVNALQPDVAVFVKYEFWLNLIQALKRFGSKIILVNGLFRENHVFFKWYGAGYRKGLGMFDHLFVQNKHSAKLLEQHGFESVTVTGDLRFERVLANAKTLKSYPQLNAFLREKFILIGGSTWPVEEAILLETLESLHQQIRLIIVPHDISESHLSSIEKQFKGKSIKRLSAMLEAYVPDVLLVDTIGDLSSLYSMSGAAFVGGGFTGALHNIIEPAVFGIPVFYGPKFDRFPEAAYFIKKQIGYAIPDSTALIEHLNWYFNNPQHRQTIKETSETVFKSNLGGTAQVYYKIKGYLSER